VTNFELDDDKLAAEYERALDSARKLIRAKVNEALDWIGIADPERREAYHSQALQLAMPMAREVYSRDYEQIRQLAAAPWIVQH
jgi:hypothetical protein